MTQNSVWTSYENLKLSTIYFCVSIIKKISLYFLNRIKKYEVCACINSSYLLLGNKLSWWWHQRNNFFYIHGFCGTGIQTRYSYGIMMVSCLYSIIFGASAGDNRIRVPWTTGDFKHEDVWHKAWDVAKAELIWEYNTLPLHVGFMSTK